MKLRGKLLTFDGFEEKVLMINMADESLWRKEEKEK